MCKVLGLGFYTTKILSFFIFIGLGPKFETDRASLST
jgi:hypothetical protein